MSRGQCFNCSQRAWLNPLGDETFSYCPASGESVEDIDLSTGHSLAIMGCLSSEESCPLFSKGQSLSKAPDFNLHPLRLKGEEILREKLTKES